jgi:hypothetical protein
MKALLGLATLIATLAVAGTALAAGDGATVTDEAYCIDAAPFASWCWDVRMTTKLTTTPSGSVSAVTNGTSSSTVTLPLFGCTHTVTEPVHEVWLERDGGLVTESRRMSSTTTFGCGGVLTTCTSTAALHYANGTVQVQRYEAACTTQ